MSTFDINCSRCARLVSYRKSIQQEYPDYHCAPVPAFGAANPGLLIVGLAPGKHGANRSGRVFTGDYAGKILYKALHQHGFSNHPCSNAANDALRLYHCRITNAVKCVPPQNKPERAEMLNCNEYLQAELKRVRKKGTVLALGKIAHDAILKALGLTLSAHPFKHGAQHLLPTQRVLLDSYHCSRYNIHTKRLRVKDFSKIIGTAKKMIHDEGLFA